MNYEQLVLTTDWRYRLVHSNLSLSEPGRGILRKLSHQEIGFIFQRPIHHPSSLESTNNIFLELKPHLKNDVFHDILAICTTGEDIILPSFRVAGADPKHSTKPKTAEQWDPVTWSGLHLTSNCNERKYCKIVQLG